MEIVANPGSDNLAQTNPAPANPAPANVSSSDLVLDVNEYVLGNIWLGEPLGEIIGRSAQSKPKKVADLVKFLEAQFKNAEDILLNLGGKELGHDGKNFVRMTQAGKSADMRRALHVHNGPKSFSALMYPDREYEEYIDVLPYHDLQKYPPNMVFLSHVVRYLRTSMDMFTDILATTQKIYDSSVVKYTEIHSMRHAQALARQDSHKYLCGAARSFRYEFPERGLIGGSLTTMLGINTDLLYQYRR